MSRDSTRLRFAGHAIRNFIAFHSDVSRWSNDPIDRRPGEKTSKTIPGEIPSHAFRDHRYNRGRFFLSSAVSRAIDRSPRNRSFKSNTLTLEREREREKFVIFFFLSVSLFYPFFLARRNR